MSLDESQIREITKKDFLTKVIALGKYISNQITSKTELILGDSFYIYPSLLTANIVVKSNWGTHPISLEKCSGKSANNLTLLKKSDWSGPSIKYEEDYYRIFKDWLSFATTWSDYLVFTQKELFEANNLDEQIKALSKMEDQPKLFHAKIETIIEFYRLV